MRRASILAIVLGCAAGPAAAASVGAPPDPSARALAAAAFIPDSDPVGRLLDHDAYAGSTSRQATLGRQSLSITTGEVHLGPAWMAGGPTSQAYEIRLVHRWPGALSFGAGPLDVDVSPHAGVGFDSFGSGSAEAGATVQLSRAEIAAQRLKAMGVRDGAEFGDRGRWYLFAAASGRAVGLNMLHGEEGGWNRAGWSTDPTSKLVGDTQIGVGWRKGPMQSSVGFVHREVKGEHLLQGVDPHADSMIAFSFSIRPRH